MCTEMYTEKKVTTVKEHRCSWCGEPIYRGSTVTYTKGKFDGAFFHCYFHDECYAQTSNLEYCEGFEFGAFKRGTFEPR